MPQPQIIREQLFPDAPKDRNVIINGRHHIWQRGTNFPGLGGVGAVYTADRWAFIRNNSGTWTVSQDPDQPTVSSVFVLEAEVTVADGTVNPTDAVQIVQIVEGINYRPLFAQPQTLSFWAKSNLTGTYHAALRNSAQTRSYVIPFTITTANVYEYKKLLITGDPGPFIPGWDSLNGVGVNLTFTLVCGSAFETALTNTWAVGNFISGPGQVNLAATAGNYFRVGEVQLEQGSIATAPFPYKSIGEELELCQRYYEKSYNVDVPPGTAGAAGSEIWEPSQTNPVTNAFNDYKTVHFSTPKRLAPTAVIYSGTSGASNRVRDTGDGSDKIPGVNTSQKYLVVFAFPSFTPAFIGTDINFQWTADAEL